MTMNATPMQRFGELHTALYTRFHLSSMALQAVNSGMSVLSFSPEQSLVIAYVRLHSEAQLVQRLIGLDEHDIDLQRHPLIELRLTETHLTLEFVLSSLAWWDQRNFIGKISIRRYRDELRDMLMTMPDETVIGHWHGTQLDRQHITIRHLRRPTVMQSWLNTFKDGHDVLRVGRWFDVRHAGADLLPQLFDTSKSLYALYRFISWTSRNDFQAFFKASNSW